MSSTEEIRAGIDRTRADLAATLNELEEKLNIPKQLGIKAHEAKISFGKDPKPWLAGAATVAAVVGGIALIALKRR
ncbi:MULTISPECIES: DUF3618 domain-containing protein [unclassified Frondihabitans]|jgi:hypothetical protein|uniref:DUF3618 domain-containing protein n=1 Tax=unclassified Frondihabitans TaxID=2626248 RepID=UPI0007009E97|nr:MULTISPECIES: DUF3618 domain-containing protein [unclassified Frondihabitans]KQQ25526.1 hypothetical protein ASF54_14005 [Frondihabitans sp. Leaf304]RPE77716.1 uncharacterized protein DUF3618 [Frondihabitans sp. PhB153]RPF07994.1 uncharacterized protein DUF3618 [Frondihabitans sp. PhB161]